MIVSFQVTGEANLNQVLEALRRYPSRSIYVQKTLFKLFGFSSGLTDPREDIIKVG
jgi:Zyg-11 family protein